MDEASHCIATAFLHQSTGEQAFLVLPSILRMPFPARVTIVIHCVVVSAGVTARIDRRVWVGIVRGSSRDEASFGLLLNFAWVASLL